MTIIYDVVVRRDSFTELVNSFETLEEACVEYLRLVKNDDLVGVPDIVEIEIEPYEQN